MERNQGFRKLDDPVFARLEHSSFVKLCLPVIPEQSSVPDHVG